MMHICVMSSHKPIRIYMGGLLLGVNTLYRLFCFFKLFPKVGKGITVLIHCQQHVARVFLPFLWVLHMRSGMSDRPHLLIGHLQTDTGLYSTYYNPWAISLTSALNGGGLIIRSELIYEYTLYKRLIPIQDLRAEEGGGIIIHHGLIIRTTHRASLTPALPWGWCIITLECGRQCLMPFVPAANRNAPMLHACPTHHVDTGGLI